MMNRFSPSFVSTLIVKPLRYFFANYAGDDLKYDDDPKQTKIDIASVNNFFKIEIQEKPRISVDRGSFAIVKSGLSDSLAEGKAMSETLGLRDEVHFVMINGEAQIIIDAKSEGTCELITDMVSHFLVWTKPYLCNSQGFKSFADPLSVSPCSIAKEDNEILRTTITIPYTFEELWSVKNDALKLKDAIFTFRNS